jgi:hypothetical protein
VRSTHTLLLLLLLRYLRFIASSHACDFCRTIARIVDATKPEVEESCACSAVDRCS